MEAVTPQRICSSCGTANNESGKFCIKCGSLLPTVNSEASVSDAGIPLAAPTNTTAHLAQRKGKIAYDPQVIERFAVRLYRTARVVVVLFVLIGLLGGGFGGYSWGYFGGDELIWATAGAILLGAVGFWFGWEIAFRLKLRAQLALCQVQIEENGR